VGSEISVAVDASFLGFLEEPGKVVPEIGAVANRLGNHVAHFMDGDEGNNVFLDQRFVAAFALSEAEMDLLALIHTVGCVLGIGSGLFEAIRICLKIPGELLDLGLIRCGRFEMKFEFVHLEADFCHGVGGVLLIGHVADGVGFIVDGTFDLDQRKLAAGHSYVAQGVGEVRGKIAHSELWGGNLCALFFSYYTKQSLY